MRILHISPYAHPFYGGANTALRMMAKLGAQSGLDVHVATTNASGYKPFHFHSGAVQIENGSTFHYFQCNILTNWFFSRPMISWLAKSIKHFDVIHLHVPFTAPFMMGAKICQYYGIPYVISLHGLMDPWCLKQKAWKKIPYIKLFEKKNFKFAKFLHVTSCIEFDFVSSLNYGSKIYLMPLAVDVKSNPSIQPRIVDSQKIKLLFLGRLHPVKAIPSLIKAVRILVNNGFHVELNIAGVGDSLYELDLKKMIDLEGVKNYIYWHGHVDDARKSALFLESNLFVMPSYHENFGLAAAEAMASGLPVILSDQVGLAKDVKDSKAGLIVPCDDPGAIAIAAQTLIKAESWLTSSTAAKELVRQKYGVQICTKSLLSLYQMACT